MDFHLAHLIGHPGRHGLYGYLELIETVRFALSSLGHNVTQAADEVRQGKINIIFGFQLLTADQVAQLPSNSIVYNFEQMTGLGLHEMTPACAATAGRLRVWDYSQKNLDVWRQLNPRVAVTHVPIGWVPSLERIPKAAQQDIDVLFYGRSTPQRMQVLAHLTDWGIKLVYACGFYDTLRDELIGRAKIVLNLNGYERSRIFEIARVSFLLANAKAVVSDIYPQSEIDADLREAIAFAPLDQIASITIALLEDDNKREQLAERGREIFRRRKAVEYIGKAVQELTP